MTAQYIEIGGQRIAMLPASDYEALLDVADSIADQAAADRAAKRRAEGEEYIPLELVSAIINGENALRVWRKYRGVTLAELAERTGSRQAMLSDLENGKAHGKPLLWRALADVLKVSVDDIMPFD